MLTRIFTHDSSSTCLAIIYMLLTSLTILALLRFKRSDPGFLDPVKDKVSDPAFPSRYCKECDCTFPARSRHSPYTGKCIALYDHHCTMLNHPVGQRNRITFWVMCVAEIVFNLATTIISFSQLAHVSSKEVDIALHQQHEGVT